MSVTLSPGIFAQSALIPATDGYQISPPIWWHTTGGEWHAESQSALDNGRYHKHSGEVQGVGLPKAQDTSLSTGSNTGRTFDVVSGTVKDDSNWPELNVKQLLMPSSVSAASFEVIDHTPTVIAPGYRVTALNPTLVIIRLGIPPPGSGPTKANRYAYLELANGDPQINFRIAMEYGQPIRVDATGVNPGPGWQPYAVASSDHTTLEQYLARHGGELRFRIDPDPIRGLLWIELGDVAFHSTDKRPDNYGNANTPANLPTRECYRFYGQNLWATFAALPLRHAAPKVTKSKRNFGRQVPNVGAAKVMPNVAGGGNDPAQVHTVNIQQGADNAISYDVTASLPDAGDGLGSTTPPKLSDVVVYIPAVWVNPSFGSFFPETALDARRVVEHQVWDDANRIGRTFGEITLNNANGKYSGSFGNFGLTLNLSNGNTYGQRMRGVMGAEDGIEISRFDGVDNKVTVGFSDNFVKMQRALCQEIILDGLALSTALRLVASIGQVAPQFLINIPDVGFPSDYSGGQYPDGFPGYILAKGTGLSPKYRFTPDQSVLSVLLELMQDSGQVDPVFGRSTPYFTYFDPYGFLHVEPYNPGYQSVVDTYSTNDPNGASAIIDESLVVATSTEQLRTAVTLQGQDALTYELLQFHQELPWNYGLVGWNRPMFERNSRWGTDRYMAQIGRTAILQSSLGTLIARLKVPFNPWRFAGQLVAVNDQKLLGGTALMTIMKMTSVVGNGLDGAGDCFSWLTCRSVQNSLVL